MPRKSSKSVTTEQQLEKAVPLAAAVPAKRKSSKKAAAAPPAEPLVEVVIEPTIEPTIEEEELQEEEELLQEEDGDIVVVTTTNPVTGETTVEKRKRAAPTKDNLLQTFDDLLRKNDEEIEAVRTTMNKARGIKYLKSLSKSLRLLKNQTSRLIARRTTTTRAVNLNSGFKKLVKISGEMAKFLGTDPTQLKSRNEVTKSICDYIRKNNLQDPSDKRIIKPDEKLRKLLKYDPTNVYIGKDGKPEKGLSYFRIQTYMKPHFINEIVEA